MVTANTTPKRRGRPPKAPVATTDSTLNPTKKAKTVLPTPNAKLVAKLVAETQATLKQLDALIKAAEQQANQLPTLKQQRQHCVMTLLSLGSLAPAKTLVVAKPNASTVTLPDVSPLVAPWVGQAQPASQDVTTAAPTGVVTPSGAPVKRRGRPAKATSGKLGTTPKGNRYGRKPVDISQVTLPNGVFIPELAMEQDKTLVPRQGSLSYDLYRAVVVSGGYATTEQVKNYLLNNDIRQPRTNQPFDEVSLATIGSKLHALAKKGLFTLNSGVCICTLGWQTDGIDPSV